MTEQIKLDEKLNSKQTKKQIHDLYVKYYGGYDDTN